MTEKCAHPACECQVPKGGPFGKYCCEHCKHAGQSRSSAATASILSAAPRGRDRARGFTDAGPEGPAYIQLNLARLQTKRL